MRRQLGRYRLTRHIATGGMGEVYFAEAPGAAGFAKRLVVKTLRADLAEDQRLVDQFIEEGRLLEALDHPNIAQIIDLGCVEGTYFLAMEHVAGFDLRALRRAMPASDRPICLPESAVLCVLVAVADALHHASVRLGSDGEPMRIVHHDVTPSNIMVRRDGHVKLVDFGIARTAIRARLPEEQLRGKLSYLSPEQAAMGPIDGRADIFSLGVVAYELLVGERPFEVAAVSALATAHHALSARVESLRDVSVSEDTVALLRDMLALSRRQRCRDAAEVSTRARERLLALSQASIELPLANALESAFDSLEAQMSGFDATLSSLLGPAPGQAPVAEMTGTLSLPGLTLGDDKPAPADTFAATPSPPSSAPGAPTVQLRKRVVFAALGLLGAAGLGGWLLGSQGSVRREMTTAGSLTTGTAEAGASRPAADRVAVDRSREVVAAPPSSASPSAEAVVDAGHSGAAPDAVAQTAEVGATSADAVTENVDAETNARAGQGALDVVSDAESRRPRPSRFSGMVEFLVLPADAEVTVDGKPVSGKGGRYRLTLRAGRHVVVVRDALTGATRRREIQLRRGATLKLPGFQLLRDVP